MGIGLKGTTSNDHGLSPTVSTLVNYGNSSTAEYIKSNIPANHTKEITISSLPISLTNFQLNPSNGNQNDIAGNNHEEKEEFNSFTQHTTTSELDRGEVRNLWL